MPAPFYESIFHLPKDAYEILGLTDKATAEDIRRAYRRLALQYHPDRNPEGAERFKEITNAYEILSDPDKKAAYDAYNRQQTAGADRTFSGMGSSVPQKEHAYFADKERYKAQHLNLAKENPAEFISKLQNNEISSSFLFDCRKEIVLASSEVATHYLSTPALWRSAGVRCLKHFAAALKSAGHLESETDHAGAFFYMMRNMSNFFKNYHIPYFGLTLVEPLILEKQPPPKPHQSHLDSIAGMVTYSQVVQGVVGDLEPLDLSPRNSSMLNILFQTFTEDDYATLLRPYFEAEDPTKLYFLFGADEFNCTDGVVDFAAPLAKYLLDSPMFKDFLTNPAIAHRLKMRALEKVLASSGIAERFPADKYNPERYGGIASLQYIILNYPNLLEAGDIQSLLFWNTNRILALILTPFTEFLDARVGRATKDNSDLPETLAKNISGWLLENEALLNNLPPTLLFNLCHFSKSLSEYVFAKAELLSQLPTVPTSPELEETAALIALAEGDDTLSSVLGMSGPTYLIFDIAAQSEHNALKCLRHEKFTQWLNEAAEAYPEQLCQSLANIQPLSPAVERLLDDKLPDTIQTLRAAYESQDKYPFFVYHAAAINSVNMLNLFSDSKRASIVNTPIVTPQGSQTLGELFPAFAQDTQSVPNRRSHEFIRVDTHLLKLCHEKKTLGELPEMLKAFNEQFLMHCVYTRGFLQKEFKLFLSHAMRNDYKNYKASIETLKQQFAFSPTLSEQLTKIEAPLTEKKEAAERERTFKRNMADLERRQREAARQAPGEGSAPPPGQGQVVPSQHRRGPLVSSRGDEPSQGGTSEEKPVGKPRGTP